MAHLIRLILRCADLKKRTLWRSLLVAAGLALIPACGRDSSSSPTSQGATGSSWTPFWVEVKYRSDEVDVGAPYFEFLGRSDSSVVRSAWFDADNQYLIINLNGTNYHYCGLPINVWVSLQQAVSLGDFYLSSIKGRYDCRINYLPAYG